MNQLSINNISSDDIMLETWLKQEVFQDYHFIRIHIYSEKFDPIATLSKSYVSLIQGGNLEITFNCMPQLLIINRLGSAAVQFGFTLIRATDFSLFLHKSEASQNQYFLSQVDISSGECINLFETVFDEKMPLEYWKWKYNSNKNLSVQVISNGKSIGHLGGIQRTFNQNNQPYKGIQFCDIAIDKANRGRTIFQALVNSYHANLDMHGGKLNYLPYGFPHKRHATLGIRLGQYEKVDEVINWAYEVKENNGVKNHSLTLVDLASIKKSYFDIFSQTYLRSLNTAGLEYFSKDLGFLKYRYLQHPQKKYFVYLDSLHNALIFIHPQKNTLRIMDYIGDIQHFTKSIHQLNQVCIEQKKSRIIFWCTKHLSTNFFDLSQFTTFSKPAIFVCWRHARINIKHPWISCGDSDCL